MKVFLLPLLLLFAALHAQAQTYTTWTQSSIIKYPINGVGQPTGIGRVTHFAYHPTDPKTMWATSASGGLWKTTTEGQYWYQLNTDFFPWTTKMSCIVVDYSNPNILYVGTGDTDYHYWWVGGRGVWKSTNGGATWTQLSNAISGMLVNRMVMSPFSTNTLLAATFNGIWKSTDAGATWTQTLNIGGTEGMRDVVFKPTAGGSNTVYACSDQRFWVSNDLGNTWTAKAAAEGLVPSDGAAFGSLRIGVSKANDNIVYVLAHQGNTRTFAGLFRSANSGNNFTRNSMASDPPTAGQPNILAYAPDGAESGSQGGYNLCITVHPNNANTVYIGSHNVWKSTDAGVSWTNRSCWYCGGSNGLHTDLHYMMFSPHYAAPYKLYIAGDGGMARTFDTNDNNWETCSDGLAATEYGSYGQNHLYKELYLGGTQDNGLQFYWNRDVTTIGGGDYYEDFESDEFNQTFMYADQRYDKYTFDMAGGESTVGQGNWATQDNLGVDLTTPTNNTGNSPKYIISPANTNLAFAYKNKIWNTQSLKGTTVWKEMILTNAGNADYKHGAASRADANLFYTVRSDNSIFRCNNATAATPTFTTLAFPGGASSNNDACLEAHNTNANIVWVTLGNRVYKSTNQGAAWINITGTLPNVGIKKIMHDRFSTNDAVYVAMAPGVYYRDNSMADWILFSRGMPTIADITDMDMFNDGTANSVIRVATYGRGIWQAELYKATPQPPIADFVIYGTQQTVGGNQAPKDPCNAYYALHDLSTGQPTSWSWSITPAAGITYVNQTSSTSQNPMIQVTASGEYTVSLTVTNAQGVSTTTNTIRYFKLNAAPVCTPIVTDTYGGGYGLGISGVQFSDINNNTALTSSYIDYTCTKTAIVYEGSTYPLTVKGGSLNGGDNVIVWIDYNNDGDFNDAGERVYNGPVGAYVHNANVTIPTGAVLNTPIRMRVAGYDNWKAKTTNTCIDNVYNEIEDYAILIKQLVTTPVDLLSFYATLESPAVKLQWITAHEKDLNYFVVEKSTAGAANWTLVDQLKAKGTDGNVTNYFCYDAHPFEGINYYRLRSYDNDGTLSQSKIIVVDLSGQYEFNIWPIPAQDILNVMINVDLSVNRDQSLVIRDLTGKEVLKTNFTEHLTAISIKDLSAGTYIAEVTAGGKVITKKFIKL
ncbi:MAG: hypothetical protein JWM14_1538 [Chitinophagaceae bacterium]|nr:hypothetical protein [Chitinophagaceae bacterium]